MLIEFRFSNCRSFRDEACLSMEPMTGGGRQDCLLPYRTTGLLPSAAILGKNGGGKSSLLRAFRLGVQFICNARWTQHESAPVPVQPFLLDDVSRHRPTTFEFTYVLDNVRYIYGFSATRAEIVEEHLYHFPKGARAQVFSRDHQDFHFRNRSERKRRQLISEAVAPSQLYLSIACAMNDGTCISAMRWFREHLLFSRDCTDIAWPLDGRPGPLHMLQSIRRCAVAADSGIQDVKFEFHQTELNTAEEIPSALPDDIRAAVERFLETLSGDPGTAGRNPAPEPLQVTFLHSGLDRAGQNCSCELPLEAESDGIRRLMALAPAVDHVLNCGGVLLADDLGNGIHPLLVQSLLSRFQSPRTNPGHAQLVFTTHSTDFLETGLFRDDQIYFVDRDAADGSSCLYSISNLSGPGTGNVRRAYLLGKYGAVPSLDIEDMQP